MVESNEGAKVYMATLELVKSIDEALQDDETEGKSDQRSGRVRFMTEEKLVPSGQERFVRCGRAINSVAPHF